MKSIRKIYVTTSIGEKPQQTHKRVVNVWRKIQISDGIVKIDIRIHGRHTSSNWSIISKRLLSSELKCTFATGKYHL